MESIPDSPCCDIFQVTSFQVVIRVAHAIVTFAQLLLLVHKTYGMDMLSLFLPLCPTFSVTYFDCGFCGLTALCYLIQWHIPAHFTYLHHYVAQRFGSQFST